MNNKPLFDVLRKVVKYGTESCHCRSTDQVQTGYVCLRCQAFAAAKKYLEQEGKVGES